MPYRFVLNEASLRGFEDRKLRGWMLSLEREAEDQARALAPVRTGRLRDSVRGRVTPPGVRPILITVEVDAPYAEYVNEGTRPHVIRTRNKKALFNAADGFGPVAGPVNHPGTRANPFLREAVSIALVRHGMRPIR